MPTLADGAAGKPCSKCGEWKPVASFGRDKSRPDGLFSYCKRCRLRDPVRADERAAQRASGLHYCTDCRGWLAPEAFSANPSRPSGVHAQCRTCACERARLWAERHPDRAKAKYVRQYWAHRDAELADYRRWYAENREAVLAAALRRSRTPVGRMRQARANALRRTRETASPATLTLAEWLEVIEAQAGLCGMCQRPFGPDLKPTIDHVIPVSRGGGLTRDNVGALCRSCNSAKRDRLIDYRAPAQPLCQSCNSKKWKRYIDYRPAFEERWRCV